MFRVCTYTLEFCIVIYFVRLWFIYAFNGLWYGDSALRDGVRAVTLMVVPIVIFTFNLKLLAMKVRYVHRDIVVGNEFG